MVSGSQTLTACVVADSAWLVGVRLLMFGSALLFCDYYYISNIRCILDSVCHWSTQATVLNGKVMSCCKTTNLHFRNSQYDFKNEATSGHKIRYVTKCVTKENINRYTAVAQTTSWQKFLKVFKNLIKTCIFHIYKIIFVFLNAILASLLHTWYENIMKI